VGCRVLICDDQALVRAGFRKLLEAEPDIEVVGEAADGEQAVALAQRRAPHVVLMDLRMPRVDGIEATRQILARATDTPKVLVLTTFRLDEYVYESLRAGASGFLLKDAPPEDLIEAINVVARGDALLDPSITRDVIEGYVRSRTGAMADPDALSELTPREREVLLNVARGQSNTEIAGGLVISEATVKTHVGNLLMKLRCRDRVQLVIAAYESGLVRTGDR
jgi:DNA-binding NarL/FixJ family response regulator